MADAEAEVITPNIDDILSALVDAPPPARQVDRVRERARQGYRSEARRPRVNYLRREWENAALGAAGEEFALAYEQARLLAAGQDRLVSKIEHVSKTRGDGERTTDERQ